MPGACMMHASCWQAWQECQCLLAAQCSTRALPQDVAEALRRLPDDVIVARNQRLKRAMDLSLKHETLPEELRAKQTPFEHYLLVRKRPFHLLPAQ